MDRLDSSPSHVPAGLPRAELVRRLAAAFPEAVSHPGESAAATALAFRGGRAAAVACLDGFDPEAYARTRNHVAGGVSRLSPWIRHGVLSLAEVRDAALERAGQAAEKFISELGWRHYWREVQASLGPGIGASIEPPAARPRRPPAAAMPGDVLAAATGLACIDEFVRRLHDTGWLHNHERMWLASWLVHARGIEWRTGADWFLSHLVDGDPASNHLSWQWIAGTFSAKPYLFNRENLDRFTGGVLCRRCPVFGRCDVEGDYEVLAERWFIDDTSGRAGPTPRILPADAWRPGPGQAPGGRPLVWLTLDSLAATSPAAAAHPDAPRVFVIDPRWLAAERPTLKRLVFIWECLADVSGVDIHVGDPRDVLPRCAAAMGCDGVAVADTSCPLVRNAAADLTAALPVAVHDWPTFCDRSRLKDLGRFSRYWQKVAGSAMQPTPP